MYVDDCTYGTHKILNSDILEAINLGSDEMVSINQLVAIAEDIAGVKLQAELSTRRPQRRPRPQQRQHPDQGTARLGSLHQPARTASKKPTLGSTTKSKPAKPRRACAPSRPWPTPDPTSGLPANHPQTMQTITKVLIGVAGVLGIASLVVGGIRGSKLAAESSERFHSQFNEAKFADIYATAAPGFKSSVTAPDFSKMMQAVQRKLGKYQSSQRQGSRSYSGSNGSFVTQEYAAQFELGLAMESLTFEIQGDEAILLNYNINSPRLIAD